MNKENLGKIEIIEKVYDLNLYNDYYDYDGYKVKTDKNQFYILIDNDQNCCESWGYLSTNDNVNDFIGKTIKKVVLTDTNLSNKEIEELQYLDEGKVQFVSFYMTDGDVLQLAVYNSHNGYYGHDIIIAQNEDILLRDTL